MEEIAHKISPDWLAKAPFPTVVLSDSRKLVASSPSAAGFAASLDQAAINDILDKVQSVEAPVVQTIKMATDRGVQFFDVTAGPLEDGYVLFARESSLEHNLRAALMESRQRFKDLVDISSDFAWEVGPKGEFIFVSQRGAVGYEPDDLIQKHSEDIVLRRDQRRSLNPFMSKSKLESEETWVLRADGEPACLLVSCLPLFDADNQWVGARGVCRDITEERERDAALARAYHRDQLLAYIVKTIRDEVEPGNMLTAAATATARALSANGCQIFRAKQDTDMVADAVFGEVAGTIPDLAQRLEDLAENEVGVYEADQWIAIYSPTRYRRVVNGAICLWRKLSRGSWNDDDRILAVDVANQLGIANEQISGHERIVQLSRTDALTGLLNRRAFFEDELPRRIERLEYNNATAALIYVDLDHFKMVNDAFGHQKGDEILLLLRDFLLKHVRPGDVIGRLGGDEFAMWLDGISEETAIQRCDALLADSTFLKEFSGSEDKPLGVSVGLAIYRPDTKEDLEGLINRADAAMYEAKRAGKGHFRLAKAFGEDEGEAS